MSALKFKHAINLIDEANQADPNIELCDGVKWPKERLYSHRMSDMLQRFNPTADDAIKLAIHAQHIQRWQLPRANYPMNKKGYYQWRTTLYKFHGDAVAKILQKVAYDNDFIERVTLAVNKKAIRTNADTQRLEDIAALVFIEHYMLAFAEKHPEYDEKKWLDIIKRTWNKMSEAAQKFALEGHVTLPKPLLHLIKKAIS